MHQIFPTVRHSETQMFFYTYIYIYISKTSKETEKFVGPVDVCP